MFVVQVIGYRYKFLVPTTLARLISADQQNCSASPIEGEQDTVGPTSVLNPQFLHVGVLRGRYGVRMGSAERRPEAAKQVYLRPYVHLFGFAQTLPPRPKFICKLYFPFLQRNIPPKAFSVKTTQQFG
jgi:hypothetical protein